MLREQRVFTHCLHFSAYEGTEFSQKTVYNKSSGPSSLNTETKIKRPSEADQKQIKQAPIYHTRKH